MMKVANRRTIFRTFLGAMIAGGGCALLLPKLATAQPASGGDAEARCAALQDFASDGAVIAAAGLAPAGPAPGREGLRETNTAPAAMLPRHCRVRGTINKRVGAGGREYGIGFELRMPVEWNGRFMFQGGAGLDGVVQPAIGTVPNSGQAPALARGFAVVSTDAGHSGSPIDASFAIDQQARVDYGYNALDKVTIAAKALVTRFYGRTPRYSYMIGCSNGGRQALTVSQRMPLYFDGIVAGDPTLRFSRVTLDEVWNLHALQKAAPKDLKGRPIYARTFSEDDLKLVRAALLERCDARDGLADGMINDWKGCGFDPGELQCKGGKTAACLSRGQVEALRDLHRGPRDKDGRPIYGPFNYDTGIASSAWRGMRLGSSQTGEANAADATLGLGAFKYLHLTPPEPGLSPASPLDLEAALERIRYTAALTDADSPLLNSFVGHGKMIVYNGLSDQGLASPVLADWYEKMLAATGPGSRDAVRLFLVPGMLHCGGGEATDQFEMLDAIVDWVEKGKEPARIIAASRGAPKRMRPLCPYPSIARYKGGDVNASDSFECRS